MKPLLTLAAMILACGTAAAQETVMELSALETRAAEVEGQWRDRASEASKYFRDVQELLKRGMQAQGAAEAQPRYETLMRVARNALGKDVARIRDGDKVPLYKQQSEVAMTLQSIHLATVTQQATYADLRNTLAQTLVSYVVGLERTRAAIRIERAPTMNVAPPQGPGIAGQDPRSIRDPVARAAYEAEIRKNTEAAAAQREQRYLTMRVEMMGRSAERYVRRVYQHAPAREGELAQHLADLEPALRIAAAGERK